MSDGMFSRHATLNAGNIAKSIIDRVGRRN